jgi:hypothetical protein
MSTMRPFTVAARAAFAAEDHPMTSPIEKPGQTKEEVEQQIREQVERDYAGKKPDTKEIPQGGPSDNGPMTAPDEDE